MYQVTKVETGFSEHPELANRTFDSILAADLEITKLMAQDYKVTDLAYDKTDVTIAWDNGEIDFFRLDANRANNISTRYAHLYRFYCNSDRQRLAHLTPKQWRAEVKAYAEFFENYAI
jgi:hypothetical protein